MLLAAYVQQSRVRTTNSSSNICSLGHIFDIGPPIDQVELVSGSFGKFGIVKEIAVARAEITIKNFIFIIYLQKALTNRFLLVNSNQLKTSCCHGYCLLTTLFVWFYTVSNIIFPEKPARMNMKSIHSRQKGVIGGRSFLVWRRLAKHGWQLTNPMIGFVLIETTGKYVAPLTAFFILRGVTSSKAPAFYPTPRVFSKFVTDVLLCIV